MADDRPNLGLDRLLATFNDFVDRNFLDAECNRHSWIRQPRAVSFLHSLPSPSSEQLRSAGPNGAHQGTELQKLSNVDRRVSGLRERSEEHTSELQSLMRISYAVFCLKKKIKNNI